MQLTILKALGCHVHMLCRALSGAQPHGKCRLCMHPRIGKVPRQATTMIKGLESKSYKTRLKELGMFNMQEKVLKKGCDSRHQMLEGLPYRRGKVPFLSCSREEDMD